MKYAKIALKVKLFRYISHFLALRALFGIRAAVAFAFAYLVHKLSPPSKGGLASIPVGPYVFYFPSLDLFAGLFTEIFLNGTYYLPCSKEPLRIIDCGANIGVSLLYFKSRAPNARITCFEPNPAARAVLEKNIAANGWQNDVTVVPVALGKEKGVVQFFVDEAVAASSGGSVANHTGKQGRSQHSYTVDVDILSPHIGGAVDLLKIDIEGPEFEVLEELRDSHKLSKVASIQLEYHYFPGSFTRKLSEMLALLESAGFRTFAEPTAKPHRVVGRDTMHAYMVFAWR